MKPTKTLILKTSHKKSVEYAKTSSDSCDALGVPWEYVEWYTEEPMHAWRSIGVPIKNIKEFRPKRNTAQLATSGHAMMWKKVYDSGEAAILFEHDSILLHKVEIDIPDNLIVVLGYKLPNPKEYNHVKAGPPKEIIETNGRGHEGAHAYAITPKTAEILLKELEEKGIQGAIDNTHFLKTRKTKVPIKIMSPTPAIGWIRESTIWNKSAIKNYEFIQSFKENHKK